MSGIVDRGLNFSRRLLSFANTGYWHTGERVSPDFVDENFTNHRKVYQFIAQMVGERTVLDVGCGTGYGTAILAQMARKAVGIDYSRQAIRYARHYYFGPDFLVMDAQRLEFPDEAFDFVFSSENFEHLANQASHLREVRRVLRRGGICFIATPNPEAFVGSQPNKYHTKENSYNELKDLLHTEFDEVVILENTNTPKQSCGFVTGGDIIVFEHHLNSEHLSNTHSFFCFAR